MSLPYIEIWTDGSGTSYGNPGGWAYVMEWVKGGDERVTREASGGAADATNNRMELSGPLMALKALKRPCRVLIHTDSEYVCNAFRQNWIAKWKQRKWVKVKNVDLWQALIKETERHDVQWAWVRGHAGNENNERCDVLAGDARRAIIEALAANAIDGLPFTLDDAELYEQLEMIGGPSSHGMTLDGYG